MKYLYTYSLHSDFFWKASRNTVTSQPHVTIYRSTSSHHNGHTKHRGRHIFPSCMAQYLITVLHALGYKFLVTVPQLSSLPYSERARKMP